MKGQRVFQKAFWLIVGLLVLGVALGFCTAPNASATGQADLQAQIGYSPDPYFVGEEIRLWFGVYNMGFAPAEEVQMCINISGAWRLDSTSAVGCDILIWCGTVAPEEECGTTFALVPEEVGEIHAEVDTWTSTFGENEMGNSSEIWIQVSESEEEEVSRVLLPLLRKNQ